MSAIVEDVVYQHAENVCSLWLQRQYAVDEPHYSFADLVHLDNRIEANIDGLRIAGEHALPFVDEMIEAKDEGAHFSKALLALEQADHTAFFGLIEKAENSSQVLTELESALAWVDPKYLRNIVKDLLTSERSAAIIVGLKACASHGRDPGKYLETHLRSKNAEIRSATLRVGAELGSRNIATLLKGKYESETDKEKYELGRALALLGERNAANISLNKIAFSGSLYNTKAVNLLVQLGDSKAGRALLKKLDAIENRERDVIRGFGLLGDPIAMDWLIKKTEVPELSRLAGGAITMITGINLVDQGLETRGQPDGFEGGGINDNPKDDNVSLDEDQDLPWPNAGLVSDWWNKSDKIPAGKCFLNGREKIKLELQGVLLHGMQRQRNAAAVSLAMLNAEAIYFNTRLPTSRQKLWMN